MPKRLSNDDPHPGEYAEGFRLPKRNRRDDEDDPPVFSNCNVCGRKLRSDDEEQMGMCEGCAYDWQKGL